VINVFRETLKIFSNRIMIVKIRTRF